MTQERKKLVELKNVSLTFNKGKSNEVKAIDDVSFDIYEGEIFGLVGESGSGKTTFLTTLGQLQEASSGKILVKGKDTGNLTEKEKTDLRFREFGFILQASNLIPFLTVKEQLDLIDRLDKKKSIKSDRQELFSLLDLEKVQNHYPKALSVVNANGLQLLEPFIIILVSCLQMSRQLAWIHNVLIK